MYNYFLFGVIGALWKKNRIYAIIQYRDEIDDHTIAVDFDGYIGEAQPRMFALINRWLEKLAVALKTRIVFEGSNILT